jgi:hypothetical protein
MRDEIFFRENAENNETCRITLIESYEAKNLKIIVV